MTSWLSMSAAARPLCDRRAFPCVPACRAERGALQTVATMAKDTSNKAPAAEVGRSDWKSRPLQGSWQRDQQ